MSELAWQQLSIKQINDQASPMPINPYILGQRKETITIRRTLIGRVERETGETILTDGRNRKKKDAKIPAYIVMSWRESRLHDAKLNEVLCAPDQQIAVNMAGDSARTE
jgi:hypothetical protein